MIRKIFKIEVAVIVILIGLYVYFVNNMVWGGVRRERALEQISQLSGEIIDLESRYVKLSGAITMELARQKGFVDVENQTGFAYASNQWIGSQP